MSLDQPFKVPDPSRYPQAPLRPGDRTAAPAPVLPLLQWLAQETTPAEAPAADDLGAFITEKLGAFDKRQEGAGAARWPRT
jgi:hypothetical protein